MQTLFRRLRDAGWFGMPRRLAEAGVLGLNRRNAEFVLAHNPRRFYPLVDDKEQTKRLAVRAGLAVPDLYGVIEIQRQVRLLPRLLADHEDFVIKPARGSQGEGIIVVSGRSARLYRRTDGTLIDEDDLKFHVSNILSGIYSLGGQPDKALVEYRVKFDPVFEKISYGGVPDVRIIVFLGVPVMAMVRLPTRMSQGKANLHQGAIGAGIDLATGRTLNAVWRNSVVETHPDTGQPVAGVAIPRWADLLAIAARSTEMTGLGYQGIDLVLDRDRGPMILEFNARPGLNIQIANRAGLEPRLRAVLGDRGALGTPAERVAYARLNFAAKAAAVAPVRELEPAQVTTGR
jgi:alpha-L-glutamate ligase-like protein